MEHDQLILSAKDVNIRFNLRGKVLHAIGDRSMTSCTLLSTSIAKPVWRHAMTSL